MMGGVYNSRKTLLRGLAHMPGTQEGMNQKRLLADLNRHIGAAKFRRVIFAVIAQGIEACGAR